MRTTRRNCLHLMLGSSIGALTYPVLTLLRDSGTSTPLVATLANFFQDKGSAKAVGVEYLRSHPGESDAELLVDRIFAGNAQRRVEFIEAGAAARRTLLGKLIREDFEHGRMVQVRGWMLSQTEARLCAIAVLV
jgi:hypothetical protein